MLHWLTHLRSRRRPRHRSAWRVELGLEPASHLRERDAPQLWAILECKIETQLAFGGVPVRSSPAPRIVFMCAILFGLEIALLLELEIARRHDNFILLLRAESSLVLPRPHKLLGHSCHILRGQKHVWPTKNVNLLRS